jgi:nucleotide-binding universal stress UspA family protein
LAAYRQILCAVDFSDSARAAFEAAADLCRRTGARLTLLHVVVPGAPYLPGERLRELRRMTDPELAERARASLRATYLEPEPELEWEVALRRGHPSVEILARLAEHPADLVVLGAQGRTGMGLVLLGSVAERVSRRAPCDCLVVKFDTAAGGV